MKSTNKWDIELILMLPYNFFLFSFIFYYEFIITNHSLYVVLDSSLSLFSPLLSFSSLFPSFLSMPCSFILPKNLLLKKSNPLEITGRWNRIRCIFSWKLHCLLWLLNLSHWSYSAASSLDLLLFYSFLLDFAFILDFHNLDFVGIVEYCWHVWDRRWELAANREGDDF